MEVVEKEADYICAFSRYQPTSSDDCLLLNEIRETNFLFLNSVYKSINKETEKGESWTNERRAVRFPLGMAADISEATILRTKHGRISKQRNAERKKTSHHK